MQLATFAAPVTAIRQTVSPDLPLPAVVDQLTDVQVAIAVLTNLADNLKATLIASGLKEVCGSQTRAVISRVAEGTTVSWKELAESFQPSAEERALFSKKKEAYSSVSVKGFN